MADVTKKNALKIHNLFWGLRDLTRGVLVVRHPRLCIFKGSCRTVRTGQEHCDSLKLGQEDHDTGPCMCMNQPWPAQGKTCMCTFLV